MFSGIKNMWREARADAATAEANDLISRYEQGNPIDRGWIISAFESVKDELEASHGQISTWRGDHKAEVANQLRNAAKVALRSDPSSGMVHSIGEFCGGIGLGLLSLHLEAQTLPGEKANRLAADIETWHRNAMKKHKPST